MLAEAVILGQPSWVLESASVRMAVTMTGAHMAPVSFHRGDLGAVEPYHISPWQGEKHGLPAGASEAILRGDFFCLPFGHAESHLGMYSHGRTAGSKWTLTDTKPSMGVRSFAIEMESALESAKVTRRFFLCDGENVVYDRTSIHGLDGAFTFGHHAVLRTPQTEGSLLVSTSRQIFGMTFPGPFGDPKRGEYQSLAMGAEFQSLDCVPSIFRETAPADCSRYPSRRGFSDLLQIAVQAEPGQPEWSAAVNTEEQFLWFSLRHPDLQPSTLLWIENCGRHSAPWNGRNCSLGIEDVCSYFDRGSVAASEENPFLKRGIRTFHRFQRDRVLNVPYIQGVVRVPAEFRHVQTVHCEARSAMFTDRNGLTVTTSVQTGFVFGKDLFENGDGTSGLAVVESQPAQRANRQIPPRNASARIRRRGH